MSPSMISEGEAVTLNGVANRFLFIDGLRGLAATVVMIEHLVPTETWEQAAAALPSGAEGRHLFGTLGVKIFFAISGFVIAHSIFGARITPGFAGNFALRRSLRLDLPFWATIFLAVGASWSAKIFLHGWDGTTPTWDAVLAHMCYAYPFLGYDPILDVFWTLILEVQFYLAYLVVVASAQRLAGDGANASILFGRWIGCLLVGTAIVSEGAGIAPFPYFLGFWNEFAIGAVCYLFHARVIGAVPLIVLLAFKAGMLVHSPMFAKAITLGAAVLLVAASQTGNLSRWLATRPLQFLGSISYSLYLVHGVVGLRVKNLRHRIHLPGGGVTWAILAMIASVFAAWLMWRLIERPSVSFAKRFRRTPEAYPVGQAIANRQEGSQPAHSASTGRARAA
jgi:peptidoglycan/LPS O-acetylase OafA/YrhL